MALIKCPECGKEISSKANACPNCGCPSSEWTIGERYFELPNFFFDENGERLVGEDTEKIILEIFHKYDKSEKLKMIKELRERAGYGLKESEEIVEGYINSQNKVTPHVEPVMPLRVTEEKPPFRGIYRYGLLGGKTEVYCPRCGSENCSYYQEQKIIPGKTKTKYTANLNPLKPFTLVNKKEKAIKKDRVVTESKIMCNDCGCIFS